MGSECCKPRNTDEYNDRHDAKEETKILVGSIASIQADRFKVVKIDDDNSVLVAKYKNKCYAIGELCPHAGTSLADAPIEHGRVRCPAHGACFDIETGDIEDFPGFDCIPSYKVNVSGSSVYVSVNKKRLPLPLAITRRMTKLVDESLRVIIIGAGAAGYTCAQTLREEGYYGRIIMFTEENYLPYDRTKLSKQLNCKYDDIRIREPRFYQDNDIEVFTNITVTKVDPSNHFIHTQGSAKPYLIYDNLFIAVGLKPRFYAPNIVGSNLKNILVLRSFDQYLEICEKARGNDVVFAGSSFVGMELAEMLSPVANHIHILSRSRVPYGIVFGELTAKSILEHMLKEYVNITFHSTDEVREFRGNNSGEVSAVYTVKKQTITCQLVIVGIGALANTQFLDETGIILNPVDHSIIVNKFLETSVPQIFAGGDAVSFPFHLSTQARANVTHWQMACVHGKVAALNILGREIYIEDTVPHFWTSVSGLNIQYIGYAECYDETLIYGNAEELCFCTVYRRRRRLGAVCCVGCAHLAAELLLVFEMHKEWIVDVPNPITTTFPNPPINGEAYHATRHEAQMNLHDINVYRTDSNPIHDIYDETQAKTRLHRVPLNLDIIIQKEDDEKALAIEIFNMRQDQADRRRMDKLLYGGPMGNIEKNTSSQ